MARERSVAQVITHKPGAYCQLKLNSGDRLLISIARPGIKIVKLRFGGLIPGRTIANWTPSELANAVAVQMKKILCRPPRRNQGRVDGLFFNSRGRKLIHNHNSTSAGVRGRGPIARQPCSKKPRWLSR